MTTSKTKPAQISELQDIFSTMKASDCQEIRDAYHNAMEGLWVLAEKLERADAQQTTPGTPLLSEHLLAAEAASIMQKSRLGWVL